MTIRQMLLGKGRSGGLLAGALAVLAACGSETEPPGEKGSEPGAMDDWKCGTHSSLPGACRCDTPTEKAGRIPTRDCSSSEYVCCTYSEGTDWKACGCLTAAALADRGYADCEALAEEVSQTVVDTCPP